ncbi:TIGR01459 family HAD-type hydrolase [Acidisphaera rubrifaciens]|uniref:Hydrolase IIA n=1 Tax=Acidisphaera rubrifaciens HS-AP3 TaxID=1231350 RepID=A0A0D6P3J4_9PROT|nr:TIGR01459 family HAD-type hydrolase [Acidisphaera rubrifaciens]GAN76330.1 hydrolase IIA [Acidisphaera rubrifaciens HS-AP3]
MRHLRGLATLADAYDGFIVDLWGVVHDGVRPYPGAISCLAALRDQGKPLVLLSNAPRRAASARTALRAMGIADDLYTDLVTSGEAVHRALRERADPWFASLGRRVFHLGPERDRNVYTGLDLEPVPTPAGASFVLNTGPDDEADPTDLAAFAPVLAACRAASLPMICANPDLDVIRDGVRMLCAGALAQQYAMLGGDVRSLGKPDPAIYGPVIDRLGVPPGRILAIGDSLRTDIAGAAACGIDACWVLGGIHADELAAGLDPADAARAVGLAPVATLSALIW